MSSSFKHKVYSLLLITLFVYFFALQAFAAPDPDTYGASGWWVPQAEYVGEDEITCGPDATVGQVKIVDEYTIEPVGDVPPWGVEVYSKEGVRLFEWSTSAPDEDTSPKFCYQLTSDYLRAYTLGNDKYYPHDGVSFSSKPEAPATFHRHSYLGYLHVRDKNGGLNEHNVAPVSPHFSYHKTDPAFSIETKSVNDLYSSSLYSTKYIALNSETAEQTSNYLATTGGVGVREFPALGLVDGHYYWAFFQTLNTTIVTDDGAEFDDGVPTSGFTTPTPFVVDTVPPVTTIELTVVATSSSEMDVSINNTVQDETSGSYTTTLYINELSPGTSTASSLVYLESGSTDQQIVNTPVTLDRGATYQFYAVSVDMAGNIATSTELIYTAPEAEEEPVLPVAQIISPTPSAPDYTAFVIEYGVDNFIDFQADIEGGVDPARFYEWEWSTASCGGVVYATQQSFSTSTVGNRIPAYGDQVTVYLRARDVLADTWSENCPSIDIIINCPESYTWDYADETCVTDTVPAPDLISQNFSISEEPFQIGSEISLIAEVSNTGELPTDTGFYDNFSYSWDGVNWTEIGEPDFHGSLVVGGVANDDVAYTPTQAGDLRLQHCVDSTNVINEEDGETPNCSVIGPLTVAHAPSADIFGTGCVIPSNESSCEGLLTWDINNAVSPNVYNVTVDTLYASNDIGNNEPVTLQHGQNIFEARDDSTALNSTSLSARCNTISYYWTGTECYPVPEITMDTDYYVVKSGTEVPVQIELTFTDTLTCDAYGLQTSVVSFDHAGTTTPQVYEFTTRPLYSSQIVQINCTTNSLSVFTEQLRIEVLGVMQES